MACHLVDKYQQAIWGLFKDRFPADYSTPPFKCDVRHTEVVNMSAVAVPKTETTERLSATLLSMILYSCLPRQTQGPSLSMDQPAQQDGGVYELQDTGSPSNCQG